MLTEYRARARGGGRGAARARDARRRRGRPTRRRARWATRSVVPAWSLRADGTEEIVETDRRRRLARRVATSPSASAVASLRRADPLATTESSAPRSGSGVLPGARSSATAAQRSVAVNAPTNARRTTPSASATDRHRDGGELVAAVEVAAVLGVDLAHRDVGRLERRELRRRGPGTSRTRPTRTARPATARRDAGSRRGRAGVGTGYTSRGGASGGRRRRNHATRADRGEDHRPRSPTVPSPRAQPPVRRVGDRRARATRRASPSTVSPTTTGWSAVTTARAAGAAAERRRAATSSPCRARSRARARWSARPAGRPTSPASSAAVTGSGPGLNTVTERVGVDVGLRARPSGAP